MYIKIMSYFILVLGAYIIVGGQTKRLKVQGKKEKGKRRNYIKMD